MPIHTKVILFSSIIASVLILMLIIPTNQSFSICMPDPDWPDAPCYGRPSDQPSAEQLRNDWSKYYDYKGKEWMAAKKTEMDNAFKTGAIKEWLHNKSENQHANYNAFKYYRLNGDISPLKQFHAGIVADSIQCKEGLQLTVKLFDKSPACVTQETRQKLIEIRWSQSNDEKIIEWKRYITVAAGRIEESSISGVPGIYKLESIGDNHILSQLLDGADACLAKTDVCSVSSGISLDRNYPFKVRVADDYSITLNPKQADDFLSKLDWTVEEDLIYTIIQWDEKYYLLVLSTFDNIRTPDVMMKLIGTSQHPVPLKRGDTLTYPIQINAWATYGDLAQVDLVAVQSAKDSGVSVWIEPNPITIPERSNATATLFIKARDDAKDGMYDVRVIGRANGHLSGLYCSNTVCPTVNVGKSDWVISTFGSGTGKGFGNADTLKSTWAELELNKKEFIKGDVVEIRTYLINNSTEPVTLDGSKHLLISVIKAQPVGYYENLYGIEARDESDKPIILQPKSKTLLVRPFYWNQATFHDFDNEQRLDPRQHKMLMDFSVGNYTWDSYVEFEIK